MVESCCIVSVHSVLDQVSLSFQTGSVFPQVLLGLGLQLLKMNLSPLQLSNPFHWSVLDLDQFWTCEDLNFGVNVPHGNLCPKCHTPCVVRKKIHLNKTTGQSGLFMWVCPVSVVPEQSPVVSCWRSPGVSCSALTSSAGSQRLSASCSAPSHPPVKHTHISTHSFVSVCVLVLFMR